MLDTILIVFTILGSILQSIKLIDDYLETRESEIRELITVSCEYTYMTYIKQVKKDKLTRKQRLHAMDITKAFFRNKCNYYIRDKLLETYIRERMMFLRDKLGKFERADTFDFGAEDEDDDKTSELAAT